MLRKRAASEAEPARPPKSTKPAAEASASSDAPARAATASGAAYAPVVGDLVEAVFAEGCWVTAMVLGLRARQVQVEFDMLEPEPARALVAGPHYSCDENDMPKDVARCYGLSPAVVLAINAPHYPGLTTSSRLRPRTLLALPHAIACSENDTPRSVASAFSLDLEALLAYNKEFVPALTASSKLHESTLLLLPPGSKPPPPPKGALGPMPYLAATIEVPAGGGWCKAEVRRLLCGLRFSVAPEGTDGLADARLRDEGKTWRWPGGVRPALFGVAEGANGAARRPIAVGDVVDVEVEEEEKTRWRAADVRRIFEDGRFCVCVDGDEEFVEVYSPDDEGTEWRWPPAGRRKAREWVAASFTRPRPPSAPELFLEAAAGGGTVQVFQDGGWWRAGLADDDLLFKPLEAKPMLLSPGGTAASSEAGPSTAAAAAAPADGASGGAAADSAAAPADAPPPLRPSVYVFTLTRNTHAPLRIGTERVRPDWEFKEGAWRVVPPPPRAPRMIQKIVPDERPVPSVRREIKEHKLASPAAPVVASPGGGPSSLGCPGLRLNPVSELAEPLSSWAWARSGSEAEVCLAAPAARGAWWAVRLLELQPQSALVSYEAFAERDGVAARLQEWVPWARVRPRPPAAPADFLDATLAGEAVQLWWEDGWWDATLLEEPARPVALAVAAETAEARVLLVRPAGVPSEPHSVACHRLRPGWQWHRLSGNEAEGEWLAPCIAPVGLLSPAPPAGAAGGVADEARRDAA